MAKKEYVKITPEGLNLVTVLNYSSIAEINGFYGKEVFFTENFSGDTQYLFQALGNIGSSARSKDLNIDISYIIISNKILDYLFDCKYVEFIADLESKMNQDSSPYRRMKYISETHLISYFENRIKLTNDEILKDLIKKYKQSQKKDVQQSLF